MPRDGTRRTDRLAAGVKALAERSSVRKQDRRSAGRRSPRIPICGAMAHRPEKHRLPCNPLSRIKISPVSAAFGTPYGVALTPRWKRLKSLVELRRTWDGDLCTRQPFGPEPALRGARMPDNGSLGTRTARKRHLPAPIGRRVPRSRSPDWPPDETSRQGQRNSVKPSSKGFR